MSTGGYDREVYEQKQKETWWCAFCYAREKRPANVGILVRDCRRCHGTMLRLKKDKR